MENKDIDMILEKQREFFQSGKTLPVEFRIEMLKKLKAAIGKYEDEITAALKKDLGKSGFEGYMCEIGLAESEIGYMLKNIRKLSAKKYVRTPMAHFPARSYKKAVPYGNTLIMSPWNYPFLLTVDPLVDAIAAGNTAVIKPSAYSPATGEIIKKLIEEIFPKEFVAVVLGGRAENSALLEKKFDFIFFTGSTSVGKTVLRNAAENLIPAVLELGGKSPCIVDSAAKIPVAARRIVFGKYLNCGQTCVAPDYILCHSSVKDEFIAAVKAEIEKQFGKKPLENKNYGKIVNEKHFDRILGLIDPEKTVFGGKSDRETLRIEPTVLDNVTWEDAVMQEEIFGPVMPILTFAHREEIYPMLKNLPKPLAFYIFTEDKAFADELTEKLPFGGGCINDVVIHLATSEMAFGGVGESGMGSYHGKDGFEAFSHTKSIVDKKTWLDVPIRYQPYNEKLKKLISYFM
ncbi:MAG: aldehyde dehydrogenase [Oscillospiraceae bacterium]|nr:aldehyde dehydrogenase [Oscillospiraceae bacterium]